MSQWLEWSEYEQSLSDDPRETESLFRIALLSTDIGVLDDAVRALQYRPTRDVFDAVLKLCRSTDAHERSVGSDILGNFGGTRDVYRDERVEILIELLRNDSNLEVQKSTARALSHMHDPRAIEPLCAVINHENTMVRYCVAEGLYGQTDSRVVAALISLSDDTEFQTRRLATYQLGRDIETDTPEIRAALWNRVTDKDPYVRGEAVYGLAKRGDLRIVETLIDALSSEASNQWNGQWIINSAEILRDSRLVPALENYAKRFPNNWQILGALECCQRGREKP